jgi:hypothetical protein
VSERSSFSAIQTGVGWALLVVGVAVFAVRFLHAGPYAMPTGGTLLVGLGALVAGGFLAWSAAPRPVAWLALAASPVLLFSCLYTTMAELEETVSIYATNSAGDPVDLRLWVVDREDGAWVGMQRSKAVEHSLDGARLEMLRGGETTCIVPVLYEDRPTVTTIHALKVEKYAVARASALVGLYPREASDTTVALRLDACSG